MVVPKRKNLSTDEYPEVRTRVPRDVYDVLLEAKERQGIDYKQTVARVLTWFSTQDSIVRAAILGQFEIDEEIARLLAKRMRGVKPTEIRPDEEDQKPRREIG